MNSSPLASICLPLWATVLSITAALRQSPGIKLKFDVAMKGARRGGLATFAEESRRWTTRSSISSADGSTPLMIDREQSTKPSLSRVHLALRRSIPIPEPSSRFPRQRQMVKQADSSRRHNEVVLCYENQWHARGNGNSISRFFFSIYFLRRYTVLSAATYRWRARWRIGRSSVPVVK